MPIYEFKCEQCNKIIENYFSKIDEPGPSCLDCGKPMKKMISQSSFILRGDGWYKPSPKGKD